MLTHEQIAELQAFDGRGAPILSVYLDLDPASQVRRTYQVAFDGLVKELQERIDEPARAGLAEEAARVRALLADETPRGVGLALFACTPGALWRVEFLAVRVRNYVAYEQKPDIAPLLELVDEYERYAVAAVDKGTARLFTVFAGEIVEREEFQDEVISRHDQGGWSQSHMQRHHEEHVHWHLKRVAQRLGELHRRRPFDRLILAGPHDATVELRRLLPRALAHRVAAVVPLQVTANDREILTKTLEVERQVEHEVETQVLADLLDHSGPAARAAVGVPATLAALWSGVVQTLVVAQGFHTDASECAHCNRLDQGRLKTCPTCGRAMRPVHDLVHRAMGRAVDQGATVSVLRGEAARTLVDRAGGLGAMLRYPTEVPESITRNQAKSA